MMIGMNSPQPLDERALMDQTFGTVRGLLTEKLQTDRLGADRAWQTLIRWFMHFLPERYTYGRGRYIEAISRTGGPEEYEQ